MKSYPCLKTFLILIVLIASIGVNAQSDLQEPKISKTHLRINVIHQDNLFTPNFGALGVYDEIRVRPGLSLALEYDWFSKKYIRFYSSVKTTFQNNPYEERSFALGSNTGLEFIAFKRILIAPRTGLDYNLVKPTDLRYRFDGEEWVIAKNTDPVFSRLTMSLGLDLGYRIRKGAKPIDILMNSTASIGGPYIKDSIPIWAWGSLSLGFRMAI